VMGIHYEHDGASLPQEAEDRLVTALDQ